MQVHFDIESLPLFNNSVITIGTFDGVHTGHQQVLTAMQQEAERIGGETVLITFHPHPRKVVVPNESLQLINTLEEKIELMERKGLDHLVVVPFTKEFSEQTADAYIKNFLVNKFKPHTIIIGYDHHFGKGRSGNFSLLEAQKGLFGYKLIEIPKHVLNEISISSTKIREALTSSQVQEANALLGYEYFFEGLVIHGDKLGRTLGYPTANLSYSDLDKIHLGEGVYAVHVFIEGEKKGGMLSIGTRPTLNDTIERVEVNIFDFDKDIYDHTIRVQVVRFLRRQEKYDSLEALKEQLHKDKEDSLRILA